MTDQDKQDPLPEELEQEIRQGRKFSQQEAIARMAGPGAMKGASAVSPVQQAENAVAGWLEDHLPDECGALQAVVHRHLKGSQALLANVERPTLGIRLYCERVLSSGELVAEIVREADVEWGRRMDERPHFDRPGTPSDPDDPYTRESVERALRTLLQSLPD
jgi:hypothetical protein